MSRPLHIAFFNRSYYPDLAATGQLLTELCEDLVCKHHCRVSVVAGPALLSLCANGNRNGHKHFWPALWSEEFNGGVRILRAAGTRFPKDHFAGRFSNYLSYFLSACWAGLRLPRPDVVVALTDPPIIGLAAYLAARRHRAALVLSYRDIFPEVGKLLHDFQSQRVNRLLEGVNRFLVRRADRIIALGEGMREHLIMAKGAPPERALIIPDWADCSLIRPAPKDNPFSRRYGLHDKFVVMHSGNIGLSQGLEHLVESASLLSTHPDIRFVFVGEGVRKKFLMEKVRSLGLQNVLFLPFQPKDTLWQSFASADLFVVSLRKGLGGLIVPSKLYGILAAGRPYVAAVDKRSEVRAVTRRFQCGLLCDPEDPAALAEQISRLYTDPARLRRMGHNARRAALHFERSRQVRAYLEVFRETAPASHPVPVPIRKVPFWKRTLDLTLSGLGLFLSAPLWPLFALAIKLEDGGPVFYSHERVGREGKPFQSWKFRSMVPDADRRFGPQQADRNDPRVTRVGRFLRATALDELPQLWNIFRGDMSFVGPRPLLPAEQEVNGGGRVTPVQQIPGFWERHSVRPGLTGLTQVYAPRDLPRRHKFRLDRFYIRKQGLGLDLKLLALSFWITLRGKWEERGSKL